MMLQKGVQLSTLDVSYVSSLSWYFLVLFGLRGLFRLLLGVNPANMSEAQFAQAQMGLALDAGNRPGGFNAEAAFKHEKDELDVTKLVLCMGV